MGFFDNVDNNNNNNNNNKEIDSLEDLLTEMIKSIPDMLDGLKDIDFTDYSNEEFLNLLLESLDKTDSIYYDLPGKGGVKEDIKASLPEWVEYDLEEEDGFSTVLGHYNVFEQLKEEVEDARIEEYQEESEDDDKKKVGKCPVCQKKSCSCGPSPSPTPTQPDTSEKKDEKKKKKKKRYSPGM